ncbi:MAG: hypothetical protein WBP26_00160 [Candidatus Saccharimonadales bacterium]
MPNIEHPSVDVYTEPGVGSAELVAYELGQILTLYQLGVQVDDKYQDHASVSDRVDLRTTEGDWTSLRVRRLPVEVAEDFTDSQNAKPSRSLTVLELQRADITDDEIDSIDEKDIVWRSYLISVLDHRPPKDEPDAEPEFASVLDGGTGRQLDDTDISWALGIINMMRKELLCGQFAETMLENLPSAGSNLMSSTGKTYEPYYPVVMGASNN